MEYSNNLLYTTFVIQLFVLMLSQTLFSNLTLSQTIYEGPASIDYFKQSFNVSSITQLPELRCWDEWKEWNGWKKYNTYYGQTNVSDISYTFFDETNMSYPVKYYKINITSQMKEKYKSSLYVTTTCELSEVCRDSSVAKLYWNMTLSECVMYSSWKSWWRYHRYYPNNENDLITHYNDYCNYSSSLDTFMYILHEKKGRINLIESKDDCSSVDECIVTTKSLIDLRNYQEGVYIVGIGGYGVEYGKYQIQLTCIQTSYPISIEEINPHQIESNLGELRCGMRLHNQSLTNDYTVMYYSLNITETTYFPFSISICVLYEDWDLDAYIIGMDELGLNYDVITKLEKYHIHSDASDCLYQNYKVIIHENINNILVGDTYWIMVQGSLNHAMDFEIYMECRDPIPPKIPEELVMGLVFGLCGLFILLFIVYYVYKWRQYIGGNKTKQGSNAGTSITPSYRRSTKGDKVGPNDSDTSDNNPDTVELVITKVTKEKTCTDNDNNTANVSTVSIRSLDRNKSVEEQLENNEDFIQLMLSDAIQSCIDQSGFDVYQVLALRYYDRTSQNVIPRRPFTSIGINTELIELSLFATTAFSAVIVGLTQTFGMSMVIYKLFMGYFVDGDIFNKLCLMDEQRWSDVFSLKLLAFLLSLVVTLFVGGLINGVKHDGLYEILSKLSLKHIQRVPNIAFWILQIGQGVNYYVCFWAVIGSYFIIFVSNTGELQDDGSSDYSSAGLDMILNAIALFFMLELDDMLVSDEDYNDCEQYLKNVLHHYVPDTRINAQYIVDKKNDDKGRANSTDVQNKFGKCEGYVISFMYHLINLFSVFVTVCCFGSGFIAPFVIFFCW